MTAAEFKRKWGRFSGKESAACQEHFNDLVIATYGREAVLCDTLRHLLAADLGPAEIIVVDQTPRHQPETTAYLESIAERIRLVRLDRPGLPRARNAGWRAARGSIVLYLDDDVIPFPGLVDAHRHAYDDPRVGGVAGRVITTGFPLPDTPSVKSRLPGVGWLFFNFAQTVAAEVASAWGCNMSFRRAQHPVRRSSNNRRIQSNRSKFTAIEKLGPGFQSNRLPNCKRNSQNSLGLSTIRNRKQDHQETSGIPRT